MDLNGFGIIDIDSNYTDDTYPAIYMNVGKKVKNYTEMNIKNEGFLIAIKYIGDGIFEEMTTHEKIISSVECLTLFEKVDEKVLKR